MNKIKKAILATLGGIDVAIYMFTPIIIGAIWISINESKLAYALFGFCLLATLFRAIKIGFMK